MKRKQWLTVYLVFIGGMVLLGDTPGKETKILDSLLPREIKGWKAVEKDQFYNPHNIFDYIDGAGEVYRSYNFKELLVRRFTRKGKPDIVADFFKMGSSRDAFGVFTHDLEGEDVEIGQDSTYNAGLLSFWKGLFFISIYAEEETDETKEVVLSLGRFAALAIKEEGEKPDLLDLLPPEYVDKKSIHYFHNHMILNYHFFVSDENIFFLDQKTEAVLGTGFEKGEEYKLLLIRYPDTKKAAKAYRSFIEAYMPDAIEQGLVQTEDKRWTAAGVIGDKIIIIFNALSDISAKGMLKKLESKG
ncbi:MAG: DUF6599 family protein [Candidatus Aminicenantaceae bacterium]